MLYASVGAWQLQPALWTVFEVVWLIQLACCAVHAACTCRHAASIVALPAACACCQQDPAVRYYIIKHVNLRTLTQYVQLAAKRGADLCNELRRLRAVRQVDGRAL